MNAPAGVTVVPCKGCGQKIFFARTPTGARMPFDASSLVYEETGQKADNMPQMRIRRHAWVSHYRTCTKPEQFSRSKSPSTEAQCPPSTSPSAS